MRGHAATFMKNFDDMIGGPDHDGLFEELVGSTVKISFELYMIVDADLGIDNSHQGIVRPIGKRT